MVKFGGRGGTGDATAALLAVLGAIPVGLGELFLTLCVLASTTAAL